MSSPAYFFQRRLDGLYCIYDDRGPVLGYEDIPCRGEAESHVRDLTERDRLRAEQEVAQLADDHAAADAMAYGAAARIGRAA